MRIARLLVIWIATIAISVTIYAYGQVEYTWYEGADGKGYALKYWKGNTLDDDPAYDKGYKHKGSVYRFEKNAEIRTILIILILAGASLFSLSVFKRKKADAC